MSETPDQTYRHKLNDMKKQAVNGRFYSETHGTNVTRNMCWGTRHLHHLPNIKTFQKDCYIQTMNSYRFFFCFKYKELM